VAHHVTCGVRPQTALTLTLSQRERDQTRYHHKISPDFQFHFQLNVHPIADLASNQLDQAKHVLGRAFGLGDDEIGVAIAHHGPADASALQPRVVDQFAGAGPARILNTQPAD